MNVRRIAAIAALGVAAAGVYAPAAAAPKKKKAPLTKSYELNMPPLFTNATEACADNRLEGISLHLEPIKPTGPGVLVATVTGFTGDWDMAVKDKDGEEIAAGAGSSTPNPGPGEDTVTVKFKKAQDITLAVCNFLGTPNAKVKYTYTYS